MEEQREKIAKKDMGGTMRLGQYEAVLKKGTHAQKAYKASSIIERHRHRYEVNSDIRTDLEAHGLCVSATTVDGELIEACEWPNHPWSIGVQFHPELKSRPTAPHPLFKEFIRAALNHSGL